VTRGEGTIAQRGREALTPVICGILAEGVADAEAEVDEFDDCANAPLRSTRNSDVMRWTCIVGRDGNECAETVEESEGKLFSECFVLVAGSSEQNKLSIRGSI